MEKIDIENIIQDLNQRLDQYFVPAEPYNIPKQDKKLLRKHKFSLGMIQLLIDNMLEFLNLNIDVKLTIENTYKNVRQFTSTTQLISEMNNNIANAQGIYWRDTQDAHHIHLREDSSFNIFNIIAILAHECTHYYLNQNNINIPKNYNDEIFTDIAAIYLGFGEYLLKGYKPIVFKNIIEEKTKSTIGYIKPGLIRKSMALIAKIRNNKNFYKPINPLQKLFYKIKYHI